VEKYSKKGGIPLSQEELEEYNRAVNLNLPKAEGVHEKKLKEAKRKKS